MFVMIIYSFTVCMLKSSSGCLRLWWSETPAEPVEPQDEGLTALGVLVVLVWLHRRGGGREGGSPPVYLVTAKDESDTHLFFCGTRKS